MVWPGLKPDPDPGVLLLSQICWVLKELKQKHDKFESPNQYLQSSKMAEKPFNSSKPRENFLLKKIKGSIGIEPTRDWPSYLKIGFVVACGRLYYHY